MKSAPVQPARVLFDDPAHGGVPYAPDYGDLYHARAGAWAQSRHVFLGGNRLPSRWAGRERFVILETGFGLGHNFLATWQAWRADPHRPRRLVFISLEKHPLTPADLARCHTGSPAPELAAQLLACWPAATHDLHTLSFEDGAVTLLLGLGDAHLWLPELVASVDAFYLDGFAPARNAELWDERVMKACARLAAPGATLATWSIARRLWDSLGAAGFEVQRAPGFANKPDMSVAHLRAPAQARRPAGPPAGRRPAPACRTALVIGAGLAGAAAARALAAQGVAVTVLERGPEAACETSGNPAGLFHPVVHAHDGAHAQLLRAGSLRTCQMLAPLVRSALVPGAVGGLLRGMSGSGDDEPPGTEATPEPATTTLARMQALIERHGLPPEFVQALDRDRAQARAGMPLASPAWWFPTAGWVSPPALVRHWLAGTGITLRTGVAVDCVAAPAGTGWQALDAEGQVLAQADVLVLANARGLLPLLAASGLEADYPLGCSRGQVSWWNGGSTAGLPRPDHPLASGGYAIGLPPELAGGLLCGATNQPGDTDPGLRPEDHRANLSRLAELAGEAVDTEAAMAAAPQGRVGWRLYSDDRLPLVGPLPVAAAERAGLPRQEQARHVPRVPGLYVLSALGSRGITLAPLLGEVLAAWITGAPQPLPASLLDAVDVARQVSRAARKAGRPAA